MFSILVTSSQLHSFPKAAITEYKLSGLKQLPGESISLVVLKDRSGSKVGPAEASEGCSVS